MKNEQQIRIITRDNYEEFLLDYLEGNLNEKELGSLKNFLQKNQDIEPIPEEITSVTLQPGAGSFQGKENLKNIPFNLSFEDYCIAKMEGDLSEKEVLAFEKYLSDNKNLEDQYRLFLKARVKPDLTVTFPNKSKLRKGRKITLFFSTISRVAVAASFLFLFSVWMKQDRGQITNPAQPDVFQNTGAGISVETPLTNSQKEGALPPMLTQRYASAQKAAFKPRSVSAKIPAQQQFAGENTWEKIPVFRVAGSRLKPYPVAFSSGRKDVFAYIPSGKLHSPFYNNGEKSVLTKVGIPENRSEVAPKKLTLLTLAGKGLVGLGWLAGKKIQFDNTYDKTNERIRIAFNTSAFGFSTTRKK